MKIIELIFLILGCFLGAGFVSGREVATYFSSFGKFSSIGIIVSGVILFFLIYLFFLLSKKSSDYSSFIQRYFGKTGAIINILFAISLFILSSSMIAGSVVIAETINVNEFIFALITAVLCYLVVLGNVRAMSKINLILVPVILLVIVMVYGINGFSTINGSVSMPIISGVTYSFMNIVTLGLFILEIGSKYTKKQILITSIISSVVITILLFICNNAIIKFHLVNVDMPILALAMQKNKTMFIITAITIWCGLFTTIISCVFMLGNYLDKYIKNYKLTVFIILILALLCSSLGFYFLVNYIYSIIGILGIILVFKVLIKEKRPVTQMS